MSTANILSSCPIHSTFPCRLGTVDSSRGVSNTISSLAGTERRLSLSVPWHTATVGVLSRNRVRNCGAAIAGMNPDLSEQESFLSGAVSDRGVCAITIQLGCEGMLSICYLLK